MTTKCNLTFEQWAKYYESFRGTDAKIDSIFTVNGYSMYPFIRPKRDAVEIVPVKNGEDIAIGDIVLFPTNSGEYCIHRVCRIDGDSVLTFGDGNLSPDKWIKKNIVVAKAVRIHRDVESGGKVVLCGAERQMRKVKVWTSMLKLRPVLLFFCHAFDRLRRTFLKAR